MSDLGLTAEDIAEIIAILDNTPYDRLDVRTGKLSLRLIRNGDGGFTQELEVAQSAEVVAQEIGQAATIEPEGITAIRSPLPGTFYRSPQPGAPAFVQPGDQVVPDTVIAIIETMKLMTSVTAGCTGVITEIVAADSQSVEADAILMRVRAA